MFLGINLGTSEVKVLLRNDAGETRLAGSGGAPARVCTRMEAARVFEAEADIGRSEIPQQRLLVICRFIDKSVLAALSRRSDHPSSTCRLQIQTLQP